MDAHTCFMFFLCQIPRKSSSFFTEPKLLQKWGANQMVLFKIRKRTFFLQKWGANLVPFFFLLSGFLPKVVGREKPHNPGHSPQTG
jgi:hypothetical protein